MTGMCMTPARRRALAVIAGHGRARESNETSYARRVVYWQTGRSLADAGLVEQDPVVDPDMTVWRLTDTGRQLATELGLELKAAG